MEEFGAAGVTSATLLPTHPYELRLVFCSVSGQTQILECKMENPNGYFPPNRVINAGKSQHNEDQACCEVVFVERRPSPRGHQPCRDGSGEPDRVRAWWEAAPLTALSPPAPLQALLSLPSLPTGQEGVLFPLLGPV